ncbi:uncharacterized protein BJ171DRAFT_425852 [Polychytrium aggregatum]|uniref:uncharacterized protein n=1 Tax=Polychytrium aggregatum TaxID=110093 RepID=UPI0022FEEEE9|nr:uncharacterized protein BJ171DRAFT_425852 [Polychytrium aggregatum]KAI9202949.1 hypothetical protein BJ171DRAFT_425852 [Polychytrium aggregatum]
MVLLEVKKAEQLLFLAEFPGSTHVAQVVDAVVDVENKRQRVVRLISACEELIQYGQLKPESQQGFSEEELEEMARREKEKKEQGSRFEEIVEKKRGKDSRGNEVLLNPDPTGRRTGEGKGHRGQSRNAGAVSSLQENIKAGRVLTADALDRCLNLISGAVTIVYPMGLVEWEPARLAIEDNEDLAGTEASKSVFDPADTSMWWAGKELAREKHLSDYVGRNEKTKIVAKIQKRGRHAPVREPPLNEEGQKALMAYYYKKQEEQKKLEENDEDDYLNSSWANPKALRNHFQGMSNISWRPK